MKKRVGVIFVLVMAVCCFGLGMYACDGGSGGGGEATALEYTLSEDETYYTVKGLGNEKQRSFIIPSTYNGKPVREIGDYAFDGCSFLKAVTIPDSVTTIGKDAFLNCERVISNENGVHYVGKWAVGCDRDVAEAELKSGTIGVAEKAFDKNVAKITISESVKYLGSDIVGYAPLKEIRVSEGNEFYSSIDGVLYNKSQTEIICVPKSKSGEVVLPKGITVIGEKQFEGGHLTSIKLPEGLVSIGNNAFEGAHLTEITIPDSVTSIGELSFSDCSALTTVTIGRGVANLGKDAFRWCTALKGVYITDLVTWCGIDFHGTDSNPLNYAESLYLNNQLVTELTIPDEITEISYCAFLACKSLTRVTIPNSVTVIGGEAFMFSGVRSVKLGNGIKEINGNTFRGCDSLESIEMGNGVKSIGNFAFEDCKVLTGVIFNGTKEEWKNIKKEDYWKYNASEFTIYCIDGTLTES